MAPELIIAKCTGVEVFFFLTFRTTSTEFYKIPPLHLDGTYGLRSLFVFQ